MVGLQNAGKTSLLRVLAVSRIGFEKGNERQSKLTFLKGGEFTLE